MQLGDWRTEGFKNPADSEPQAACSKVGVSGLGDGLLQRGWRAAKEREEQRRLVQMHWVWKELGKRARCGGDSEGISLSMASRPRSLGLSQPPPSSPESCIPWIPFMSAPPSPSSLLVLPSGGKRASSSLLWNFPQEAAPRTFPLQHCAQDQLS